MVFNEDIAPRGFGLLRVRRCWRWKQAPGHQMRCNGDIKKPIRMLCDLLRTQEHGAGMGIDAYAGNSIRIETAHIALRIVKAHQRVDFCDSGKSAVDGAMGRIFVEAGDTDFDQRA